MLHTISQRALALCVVLLIAARARAQTAPPAAEDPFAAHRWHVEGAVHAASEAWNYNGSHEELYGISEGLTYGVREGLVLTLNQRVYYLSQRANDTWVLGVTFGIRGRVYRRGRTSAFLEGNVGISDAAIAAPPRGTRFNYLAFGSGGVLVRVKPRIHLLAALQLIHISNNSLRGPGRNPDIEAIGPRLGLVMGFGPHMSCGVRGSAVQDRIGR
ncbi:MAG: hypothetical protein DMF84_03620 [Acidobacteria bacterium]|nr:MAG: hypothetical protein DMF84_03620 [Acidobacteriota bacterium]